MTKISSGKFLLFTTLTVILSATIKHSEAQTVRVLFDATKGEMAGNADWVIDADQTNLSVGSGGPYISSPGHQSNPQQIPTPAQSTVYSTTAETYWTGALSSWGIDCVNKGYEVETLPWNGQITYNNSSNSQDLSNYKVFVIDEPNLVFSDAEKTALLQFVQNGGGLFIISDHNMSDRNGDGWDSPHIWNDFFTNNSIVSNPFGIAFDLSDFSQTSTNISATATDSIIHGPMGTVTKVLWSDGTSMTLDTIKNPSIKGVIFKNGTTPGVTKAMVSYGYYGIGRIAAMGDSSPSDDGTGNPNCTLYNGYTEDASGNHRLLLMNMTIWLAGGVIDSAATAPTSVVNTGAAQNKVTIFPNPSTGSQHLVADCMLTNAGITVYTPSGAEVMHSNVSQLAQGEAFNFSLSKGIYFIKITSDQLVQTSAVTIY